METVARQTKKLQGRNSAGVQSLSATARCHHCGRGNHKEKDCKFKDAKCHKCGKTGHIAPVCRSKKKPWKGPASRSANWLEEESEEETLEQTTNHIEEPLF